MRRRRDSIGEIGRDIAATVGQQVGAFAFDVINLNDAQRVRLVLLWRGAFEDVHHLTRCQEHPFIGGWTRNLVSRRPELGVV